MCHLLHSATRGRHAIDVSMIGLEIEPAAVTRIEHVADPVVAFCHLLRRASARRHFPDLDRTASIRGIDHPPSVRGQIGAILVARREGDLLRLASDDVESEKLEKSVAHYGIGEGAAVRRYGRFVTLFEVFTGGQEFFGVTAVNEDDPRSALSVWVPAHKV